MPDSLKYDGCLSLQFCSTEDSCCFRERDMAAVFLPYCENNKNMKQTISVSTGKNSQIRINYFFEPIRRFMSYIGGVNLTTSEALRLFIWALSFSLLPIAGMTNNIVIIALFTTIFIASCRAIKGIRKGGNL